MFGIFIAGSILVYCLSEVSKASKNYNSERQEVIDSAKKYKGGDSPTYC